METVKKIMLTILGYVFKWARKKLKEMEPEKVGEKKDGKKN